MKNLFFISLSIIISLQLAGCITTGTSSKRDELGEVRSTLSEEIIALKDQVNSLGGRIDELGYRIDTISEIQSQQSTEINATLKEWQKQTQTNLQNKIDNLETKNKAILEKQSQDKKELQNKIDIIIQEISEENKEIRRQLESLRKSISGATVDGYYTVVKGDSLSQIAALYGVSLKTLMEANDITDPNSIRVGQKLIIP